MAKLIRNDFGGILNALNKMIIAEVKAALSLLPNKCIESFGSYRIPLCRIVVSTGGDYIPKDFSVRRVWIDNDGDLRFSEHNSDEDYDPDEDYSEYDDMLDITDFAYLINQIAEKIENDDTIDIRYTEPQNVFYSPRKIGDEIKWIDPDGKKCHTVITGILAEQEPQEPTEIIYTTNIMIDDVLRTAYLDESAILND